MRVLLIEDDVRLAEQTAEYLREHQIEVELAHDGELGLVRAIRGGHDLVLLDLMLPRVDGLEVCRKLRERSAVPVIMLSARGEALDRVLGLELGADDYLAKPFAPRELVARMRAVLRRGRGAVANDEDDHIVSIGELRIDAAKRKATVGDAALSLSAWQFDLLLTLARARGQVLDRRRLYEHVAHLRGADTGDYDPSVDRSIDVHLSKVRQALANAKPGAEALLRTVRGVGYALDDEHAGGDHDR